MNVHFVITCDEADTRSGSYFEMCLTDILDFFTEKETDELQFKKIVVKSSNCNSVYLEMKINSVSPNKFVFIGYSHGNDNGLCVVNNTYVEKGHNTKQFSQSVFFSVACQVGSSLAHELIENGCAAFIGYNDKSFYLNDFIQIFINCDNAGIKAFVEGNKSIEEAFESMLNYYDYQIKKAYSLKQPFLTQALISSREALVFLGNSALRFSDVMY